MSDKYYLIDTSILLELIDVPNMAKQPKEVRASFVEKMKAGGKFCIPLAAIIETGNHIAQNGNGQQRRERAQAFVKYVIQTFNEESPFIKLDFITNEELQKWIQEFPNCAMRNDSKGKGMGIGDLSIIKDKIKLEKQFPKATISIWSADGHLDSYNIKGEN